VGASGALPTDYTGSALDGSGSIDVFRNIKNLEGSKFNDFLYGDANDNSIDGRGGSDFIDGGEGSDTIEFNQAAAGIHVDLSQSLVLDDGQGVGSAASGEAVEQDTLLNIENVDGGAFDDLIVGDGVGNVLNGYEGNDTLSGGAGNDVIDGGEGIDLAKFVGSFDAYDIAFDVNTGVLTLTHSATGGDGVDTLTNVERFQFADLFYVLNSSGQLVPEPPPGG
jgi:Ca2+-binding RTX toxin-like protein